MGEEWWGGDIRLKSRGGPPTRPAFQRVLVLLGKKVRENDRKPPEFTFEKTINENWFSRASFSFQALQLLGQRANAQREPPRRMTTTGTTEPSCLQEARGKTLSVGALLNVLENGESTFY